MTRLREGGLPIREGRHEVGPLVLDADVVVVGSGSGGAVAARECARAGLSVVVLEEGGYHTPQAYAKYSPTTSMGHLFRDAGFTMAFGYGETPMMSVLAGRCVGGSSVLTGGVCFRIPEHVRHHWQHELGLDGLSKRQLDAIYTELEHDLSVATVPDSMRSRSTELFVQGAERLGISMQAIRRNMSGCKGASRCNFGCPHLAKRSVDVVMLSEVAQRGCTIVSDARVSRIVLEGGVARGVRGELLSEDGARKATFEVRAKRTIVSCGSLHTPILLRRSGLTSPHIGRHLTLHPSFRIAALFDEDVSGWDGAMQSVYSDDFANEGIKLVGAYTSPSILAAAFPGVGEEHRARVRALPKLAFFGAMIHDDPSGKVRRFLGREPLITYSMSDRDRGRMWRGIEILGELAFAAGARQVFVPVYGQEPLGSMRELHAFLSKPPSARRVEAMSFHPLGTARMSQTPDLGVVSTTGECWDAKNLYVMDGSVLPTSLGVNSQLPIMAVSLLLARRLMRESAASQG